MHKVRIRDKMNQSQYCLSTFWCDLSLSLGEEWRPKLRLESGLKKMKMMAIEFGVARYANCKMFEKEPEFFVSGFIFSVSDESGCLWFITNDSITSTDIYDGWCCMKRVHSQPWPPLKLINNVDICVIFY